MQANNVKEELRIGRAVEGPAMTEEMKRCAEGIWNAITKYLKFDNEAIFKDPDWPYLWNSDNKKDK